MVATIKVLTGSTRGAAAYFDLLEGEPTSSYYGTEHTGTWHGLAAKALGLDGNVDRADFENILAGNAPDGSQLVSRKKRTKSKCPPKPTKDGVEQKKNDPKKSASVKQKRQHKPVIALDVPMSVPKSVSVLHAIGPRWVRDKIESALQAAGTKTLDNVEALLPLGRRGKGGQEEIQSKLVVSTFMHTLSRDNEPQLHLHCVIANLCLGADGRWSAVNSRLLHQWTPAIGRIFRCNLARELKRSLGVELVRPVKNGITESWFEIEGVSRTVIDTFSSRRRAILESLSPDQRADAKQRQHASLNTRRKKDQSPDLPQLREAWKNQAAKKGLDEDRIVGLCNRASDREPLPDFRKVFDQSVRDLGRAKSHFHEADLVSAVCEAYQHHGIDPMKLVKRTREEMLVSPELVTVHERPANSRLSSRENWEIEQKLIRDAKALQESVGITVKDRVVRKVLRSHSHLDGEQKKAVEHLLTSKSGVRIMSGVAGAGKSTVVDAIRDAFERSGHRVLGTALAGKAACELSDRGGIETRTVASYLHHLERNSEVDPNFRTTE